MFCPSCGEKNADDSRFCGECGQDLAPAPAAVPTHAVHHHAVHAEAAPVPVQVAPVQVVPRPNAFCHACGGPVDGASPFCHHCGAPALAPPPVDGLICRICGQHSPRDKVICARCRGVFGLPSDFMMQGDDYEYAGDRQGLAALRATPGIAQVADYISRKLGKPFIEGQFIGSSIRVSEDQFPNIHRLAGIAARVLCLPQLPQIYVSGDRGWASETFGTATDSFVVLGTFLTRQLSEAELLFVIGHELGHIKSGHAMYRTVAQILAGQQSGNAMSGGILGLLDVTRLVTLPIELKLLQWVRQSEVTGDAAGLAVVGDLDLAHKVLIIMALKSADMYRQINLEAYLRQQEELDQNIVKLSEYVSQSTPYIATRVRLMREYAGSPHFHALRGRIKHSRDLADTVRAIEDLKNPPEPSPTDAPPVDDGNLRGLCPHCQAPFKVAKDKLPSAGKVALRCKQCKKTFPVNTSTEEPD